MAHALERVEVVKNVMHDNIRYLQCFCVTGFHCYTIITGKHLQPCLINPLIRIAMESSAKVEGILESAGMISSRFMYTYNMLLA